MRIHHVGYLVRNIEKAELYFEKLGYVPEGEVCFDEYRNADIIFIASHGYRIELVCPNKKSDIYPLLKKYGNSPYHICYEVEDIDLSVEELRSNGYLMFTKIAPAPAIDMNATVVFLTHAQVGMIELVQLSGGEDK